MEDTSQVSMNQFVQKLRGQNEKLRSELEELKEQLKQALKAQRKTEIEQGRPKFVESEDREENDLQGRLQALKKEAAGLRMQLTAKNDETVSKLSNELTYLRSTLKSLDREHDSLLKIAKEQERAMTSIFNEEEAKLKLDGLKKELADLTERERRIKSELMEKETERKANHAQMISLETQIRALMKKSKGVVVSENREEEKKHEEELAKWEKMKNMLEKAIKTDEKTMRQRENALETTLKAAEEEEKRRNEAVAKAEEDLKVKELKIKELKATERKLQQRNTELRQLEEQRKEEEFQAKQSTEQLQQAVEKVME